jgi:hypothetical protein
VPALYFQLQRAAHGMAGMLLCLLLAACGGGGGGGGSGASSSNASTSTAVGFPPSTALITDANVAAITVAEGPGRNVNIPYVTVTVCLPGRSDSAGCSTVDHVLLDTGSTGLRLFANQVGVALPAHTIGASATISECAQFLTTLAWGPVKQADVQIGGLRTTTAVPVQLMVDAADFGAVPQDVCGSAPVLSGRTSTRNNTQALSANGILGVGLFSYDGQTYFDCASPDSSCQLRPRHSEQVQNPVSLFATHNNGVVVQLPALGAAGAASASGFLVFGVETASNNTLGAANLVAMNNSGVFFTSLYRGRNYNASFFDTGSNGLFFDDLSITSCSGGFADFYCPVSALGLWASIPLVNAQSTTVSFGLANAQTLFNDPASRGSYALNNLAGHFYPAGSPSVSNNFDWGLPFFFGRSVYTVIEGRSVVTGAGTLTGPFNAFTD